MTTVYVLTLAADHEGESLMGVYATHEDAIAASETWSEDRGVLRSYEHWLIRPLQVGAPADMQF